MRALGWAGMELSEATKARALALASGCVAAAELDEEEAIAGVGGAVRSSTDFCLRRSASRR